MATKKQQPLSKAENQKLIEFIGNAVLSNVAFPPTIPGGSSLTIQDILHNRTIPSLTQYADFLEKQGGKLNRLDKINGVEQKMIAGSDISYEATVEIIDIITKDKLYKEYLSSTEKRRIEIKKELEKMETPKERKAKLEKELKSLG